MKKSDSEVMLVASAPQGLLVGDGENRAGLNRLVGRQFAMRIEALMPDPQVDSRPKRRCFSAAYKVCVVEEAERCAQTGAVGALLGRDGLYSSHLSNWREQYRSGGLDALCDNKRGRNATGGIASLNPWLISPIAIEM